MSWQIGPKLQEALDLIRESGVKWNRDREEEVVERKSEDHQLIGIQCNPPADPRIKDRSDPLDALDRILLNHAAEVTGETVAADLAEVGVLLVTEERLAAALKKVARDKDHAEGLRKGYSDNYFDPDAAALFAALSAVNPKDHTVEGPPREKSPIVEVVGLGDGTMNVKTEDGMAWHLTEAEYLAWPRAVAEPEVTE